MPGHTEYSGPGQVALLAGIVGLARGSSGLESVYVVGQQTVTYKNNQDCTVHISVSNFENDGSKEARLRLVWRCIASTDPWRGDSLNKAEHLHELLQHPPGFLMDDVPSGIHNDGIIMMAVSFI